MATEDAPPAIALTRPRASGSSPYQHHFLREPLRGNDGHDNRVTYLFRLFPLSAGLFPYYTTAEQEARKRPILARGQGQQRFVRSQEQERQQEVSK